MTIETNNQILLTEKKIHQIETDYNLDRWKIQNKNTTNYKKLSGREASKVLREIVSETIEKFEVK